MPAPSNYNHTDPLRYLVHGTHDADKRNTSLENVRTAGGWITAVMVNGFNAPDPPMIGVQYRIRFDTDDLDFRGHIDLQGGTSGTVAFYLARPFWRAADISFLIDVFEEETDTFTIARVVVSSVDGAVTLYWPAVV